MVRHSNNRIGFEHSGGRPQTVPHDPPFAATANRANGDALLPIVNGVDGERYVIVGSNAASMPRQLVLTSRQAVTALQISARQLWELTHRGEIPHVRIGRRVYYPLCELEAWLQSKVIKRSVAASSAVIDEASTDNTLFTTGSRD